MYVAKVRIGLKRGVTDPEGQNTLKTLHLLGFQTIESVTTERIVRLRLTSPAKHEAEAEAERACRRLLTNPIIHEYTIEVEEAR